MELAICVLLILVLVVLVAELYIFANRFYEINVKQDEILRRLIELKSCDRTEEIVECLNLMSNSYGKLTDRYAGISEKCNEMAESLKAVNDQYSDIYEQFSYCKSDLSEIKEFFRKSLTENQNEIDNTVITAYG